MIVVGLGNPGAKYANNRHNVGALFVQSVAEAEQESSWRESTDRSFAYIRMSAAGADHTIVLTRCYMNQSGGIVSRILRYFEADLVDLCIAHDDLDLELGTWKLGFARGPKLHNGIISIESALKSKHFHRLRIGVDRRDLSQRVSGETYVLQDFTPDELHTIQGHFSLMWDAILRVQLPRVGQ